MDLTTRLAADFMSWYELRWPEVEAMLFGVNAYPWDALKEEVRSYDPATLGIIAATGLDEADPSTPRRTLYQVHAKPWLDERASGLELLVIIAATALACRMSDLHHGLIEGIPEELAEMLLQIGDGPAVPFVHGREYTSQHPHGVHVG